MFGKIKDLMTGGTSRLTGKSDLLEAICAGCALVAAADGEVEESELMATADALSAHELLAKAFTPTQIDAAAEKMFKAAKGGMMGRTRLWKEVEEAKGKSSRDDLELALAICVDVATSDGQIEAAERPVLERIARSWGVSLQAVMAA